MRTIKGQSVSRINSLQRGESHQKYYLTVTVKKYVQMEILITDIFRIG